MKCPPALLRVMGVSMLLKNEGPPCELLELLLTGSEPHNVTSSALQLTHNFDTPYNDTAKAESALLATKASVCPRDT